jgi:hypothetical protein
MAVQASKDAAAKDRIIKHLNADHQKSLSYYLQHYKELSARAASKPLARDITFEALTIESVDGKSHTIPFNPPMKSWSEARMRTVEMDREARAALDISPISITAYEPPKSPAHLTVFGLCVFTFVVFVIRNRIVEGTWFYDNVLPWYPGGPKWFLWIAKVIALPVLGIHLGEAYWLDRSRLRKHGVERGTALWYKWIASCFIEGMGCFQRIDATVKRKTLEAEKAKH